MFNKPMDSKGLRRVVNFKSSIILIHIIPRTMFWHEEPFFAYPSHKKDQLDNVYVFVKDTGRDKGQSERKSERE